MKNILLIIPNLSFGGAQESFAKLSRLLSVHYNVHNIVFNTAGAVNYHLGGRGELISLNVPASGNWVSKFYFFLQRVIRVRYFKKQLNIDVSISFLEGADYVNILSRYGDKVVLSVRGSKFHDQNITGVLGWIRLRLLMPLLYQRADKIVTVAYGVKEELVSILPEDKIEVVYNGYDFSRINKLATEQNQIYHLSLEPYIVGVGRLSPEKGFHHLVHVFSEVVKKVTDLKLLLIGDGEQGPYLVDLCKAFNLRVDADALGLGKDEKPHVIFIGYQQNPYGLMKNAKCLALCSSAEGFPNVLPEAMSLRIPVFSTDCPHGPGEILKPKSNGFSEFGWLGPMFCEKDSIDRWSQAIIEIVSDEGLRKHYGKRGEERALNFSLEAMEQHWYSIIQNVI